MTEYEKMLAGMVYDVLDTEVAAEVKRSRQLCLDYNRTNQDEEQKRTEILKELLPNASFDGYFLMELPIAIDFAKDLKIGRNFYSNTNLTVVGSAPITIGDDVFIGPNVTIASGVHALVAEERIIRAYEDGVYHDYEYGKPITIGSRVWIASNVVICAGVHIGDDTVIGAGSVVTQDIPAGVIAFGTPCRVHRKVTQADSMYRKALRQSE